MQIFKKFTSFFPKQQEGSGKMAQQLRALSAFIRCQVLAGLQGLAWLGQCRNEEKTNTQKSWDWAVWALQGRSLSTLEA